MSFNINNQNAGVINNVDGDQRIVGGQHGSYVSVAAAQTAVRDLRAVIRQAGLDDDPTGTVARTLDEIDAGLQAPEPDRHRIADAIRRLTQILVDAGALATAGASLTAPLLALTGWLGNLGAPIAAMLPR